MQQPIGDPPPQHPSPQHSAIYKAPEVTPEEVHLERPQANSNEPSHALAHSSQPNNAPTAIAGGRRISVLPQGQVTAGGVAAGSVVGRRCLLRGSRTR